MKDEFKFKNFNIKQDKCAMKVGTDGVLLGSWAQGGERILDIGTGTGLIALMMKQRYPTASIDAIDIDSDAYNQAIENVKLNHYESSIHVYNSSLQNFHPESHYDAIICNPPFFINSLKSPDNKKNIARHTETLSYADLFQNVKRLLREDGIFSAIIPKENIEPFLTESYISGMFIHQKYWIATVKGKPEKRALLSFQKFSYCPFKEDHKVLFEADGKKTEWYKNLTDNFYMDIID